MTQQWDEFSKSLAESVPRRESLRRLGAVFAGAVLSPLGLGTALARGADACKTFCNRCPKSQRSRCLTACNACDRDTNRLCGSCGSYVCCGSGRTCCSGYCTDPRSDVLNCGACGFVCDEPGLYESGACIDGRCEYICADGAVDCDGTCTFPGWDRNNCGACGNVCPDWAPYCNQGACECPPGMTQCGNSCLHLDSDRDNCGACGNVCAGDTPYCNAGTCGQIRCFGGQVLCGGICVEISLDPSNCGGCGVVCGPGENCAGGLCQSAEPPG